MFSAGFMAWVWGGECLMVRSGWLLLSHSSSSCTLRGPVRLESGLVLVMTGSLSKWSWRSVALGKRRRTKPSSASNASMHVRAVFSFMGMG